jgi:hypothetical protein
LESKGNDPELETNTTGVTTRKEFVTSDSITTFRRPPNSIFGHRMNPNQVCYTTTTTK